MQKRQKMPHISRNMVTWFAVNAWDARRQLDGRQRNHFSTRRLWAIFASFLYDSWCSKCRHSHCNDSSL